MDVITSFFESLRAWAENNSYLNAFSWLFNSGIIITATFIFFKVVAPRLAQNRWFNVHLDKVDAKIAKLDDKMDQVIGINFNLNRQLEVLREAMDIAYSNSNLDSMTKQLIHTLLKSILDGKDINVKEELKELNEEGKEVAVSLLNKAKDSADNLKKSALQQLQENVEKLEDTLKEEAKEEA